MLKVVDPVGDMDVEDEMGDHTIAAVEKSGIFAEDMGKMHLVDFRKYRCTTLNNLNFYANKKCFQCFYS